MATETIKSKKWAILGAMIGALVFPALSVLLDIAVHFVRVILGA